MTVDNDHEAITCSECRWWDRERMKATGGHCGSDFVAPCLHYPVLMGCNDKINNCPYFEFYNTILAAKEEIEKHRGQNEALTPP